MRVSLFSVVAVVLAMMPLQGSGEHLGAVSSRSSLEAPSSFALRKKIKTMPTAPAFGIARGGQAAAKAQDSESTPFITKDNLGWAISFVLSIIYLFLFITESKKDTPSCSVNMGGFCVTNLVKDGTKSSCPRIMNSHTWSFVEDVIFTALCFVLPSKQGFAKRLSLASVVLSHGILHANLGFGLACASSGPEKAELIFGIFGAFISLAILNMGSDFGPSIVAAGTLLGGYLTVKLSEDGRGVSSIFLITQLWVTVSGFLKPNKDFVNPLMGNLFVPTCAVSIIEILACCNSDGSPSWFNKLGGHFWYDFFLHLSLLASL